MHLRKNALVKNVVQDEINNYIQLVHVQLQLPISASHLKFFFKHKLALNTISAKSKPFCFSSQLMLTIQQLPVPLSATCLLD